MAPPTTYNPYRMLPVIHVMTGLPGSGKSTAAFELLVNARGRMRRVNLDDLRNMLDRPGPGAERFWSHPHEQMVEEVQDATIRAAVLAGWDLVVDNTNLTPHAPTRIKAAAGCLAQYVVHDLTGVPVEECIRRDAARPEPVGADVIRGLAEKHAAALATGWRLTDKWMNTPDYTAADGARWARTHRAPTEDEDGGRPWKTPVR